MSRTPGGTYAAGWNALPVSFLFALTTAPILHVTLHNDVCEFKFDNLQNGCCKFRLGILMIPMQTLHGRSCCQAWLSPFRCSFLAPAWQIHFVTGICCDSFSRFHSWCHKHNSCVIFCAIICDVILRWKPDLQRFCFFFYSSSEIVLHNALGPALNKIEVPNCCKNIFLAHFKYIIIAIASPRTFQVSPLFFATNFVSFETSDSKGLVGFGTHMATAGNFLAGESPNLANKLLDDYCWPRSSIVSTVTTFKIG